MKLYVAYEDILDIPRHNGYNSGHILITVSPLIARVLVTFDNMTRSLVLNFLTLRTPHVDGGSHTSWHCPCQLPDFFEV